MLDTPDLGAHPLRQSECAGPAQVTPTAVSDRPLGSGQLRPAAVPPLQGMGSRIRPDYAPESAALFACYQGRRSMLVSQDFGPTLDAIPLRRIGCAGLAGGTCAIGPFHAVRFDDAL
jgi:hypothetical protein